VSPTSGTNSGEVIVTVNTAEQSLGNYSGTITIESNGGEPKQVNIYLIVSSEQPTVGSIHVTSTPSGADIDLDGSHEGTTPKTISGVPVGSHTIKVTASGYEDYNRRVTVTDGETETVNAILDKKTGAIYVSSSPSEAYISLDGINKGRTPMTIHNVKEGSHTIKITASGYEDYNRRVTVTAGDTEDVIANLVKQTGAIYVSSTPTGANIYLDKVYQGRTPLRIDNVGLGSHTIKINKTFYSASYTRVTVTAGDTVDVSVTLKPIPIRTLPYVRETIPIEKEQFYK